MLWVDKHRPKSLDKMDYHTVLNERLKRIAKSGDLPHLLFYGKSGAGKKTRVLGLLREIFGSGVEKVKLDRRVFKTSRNKKIELNTLSSNYHIEMNPSDAGTSDTDVVQEVIKEIAQYHPLDSNSFKVVFLSEADSLSRNAQHALRRTMEKYMSSCRIIMCCESLNKIISPLRSRCLAIRVPAPTEEEVCKVLTKVGEKENFRVNAQLATKVTRHSERNLRRALLLLETCKVQNCTADTSQLPVPDWERFTAKLAADICKKQSPQVLLQARSDLYELLANCIPPHVILRKLCDEMMRKVDDELKHEVLQWAAYYENRIQQGTKDIFHLEAFVAKFMVLYKNYLIKLYA